MCGIVGIVGSAPVANRLVDALKRLEYRGYDSAGIATLEAGDISRRRAEGKLGNLGAVLEKRPLPGKIGIGQASSAAKSGGNTGNGTLTMDVTTPIRTGAKAGIYTVRFIAAASNNGTFRVEDPDLLVR